MSNNNDVIDILRSKATKAVASQKLAFSVFALDPLEPGEVEILGADTVLSAVIRFGDFLKHLGKNKILLKLTSECSMLHYTYQLSEQYFDMLESSEDLVEDTTIFFNHNKRTIEKKIKNFKQCIIVELKK